MHMLRGMRVTSREMQSFELEKSGASSKKASCVLPLKRPFYDILNFHFTLTLKVEDYSLVSS